MEAIKKVSVPETYPPEEGCYLRGNDFSPVAVCVILHRIREETPPELTQLVRTAVESGAALAGTLQTENIGLEKLMCNIVANPNIRYMLLCGPESPGHSTGDAILALMANGVDARKKIIGAKAPTPYLFNISLESIERFRQQIQVINCLNEGLPELVQQVVVSCYQEQPTLFREYLLYDIGAFPEPPICHGITWRVTQPEKEPKDDAERQQVSKFQAVQALIQQRRAARDKSDPAS